MQDRESDGSWHPGDPHGLRQVRRAFIWIGAVFVIWATARVWMLGDRFLFYYAIAGVFFLVAILAEPVMDRLRRRREPF